MPSGSYVAVSISSSDKIGRRIKGWLANLSAKLYFTRTLIIHIYNIFWGIYISKEWNSARGGVNYPSLPIIQPSCTYNTNSIIKAIYQNELYSVLQDYRRTNWRAIAFFRFPFNFGCKRLVKALMWNSIQLKFQLSQSMLYVFPAIVLRNIQVLKVPLLYGHYNTFSI